MGNPPRVTAGLGEVSGGAHDDGGGSARRRIAGARVPATRASLGPRHLAQDDQEDDVALTEGLRWVEVRRRVTVDNGRRRRQVGLRGKVDAEALRASGHRGSTRGDPAKVLWGLGRSGDHRRRGIARAEQDTGGGPRARFRRGQGSGSRVEASGSFLAGRQSCCEPWPELGCTGAAGPRRSRGAARRSKRPVVLGIRGGCSAAVGHKEGLREGLRGPIKEEAGGLGVHAPVGIAAVIRAGEADRATALRDSGSGKETSGRRARTGDWPMGSCSGTGWSGATCSDGTAGRNRGSRLGEEEGKEGDGHRQVGSG
jgi:hypothetical protein